MTRSEAGHAGVAPWCWMCDTTETPRAAEHVYPRWLLGRLGAEAHTFPGGRPVLRLTVAEVCAACNSGWMSGLENAFRSVAFDQPRRGPLVATTQLILARWFAKTAVLVDVAVAGRSAFGAPTRHALRRGLPETVHVHLARLGGAKTRIDHRAAAGDGVLAVALRVGDLVGVVHHGDAVRPARPLLRIGPAQRRRIAWDQLPAVRSLEEAVRLR